LIDTETGFGPENIRTSRQGKDLKVSFEGSNTTDLVIEDYYKVSPEGYNGLIGEAESVRFYEYIPENALGMSSVPMLAESGPVVGMALGGAEVAPAGAAVGLLAAGLFSPWLLGAGALGVAAAAGGGGTGGGTTSSSNANAKIQINSIDDGLSTTSGSKDTGTSNKDFYTADNTLSYFGKVSGFTMNGDQIKLELKDKSGSVISTGFVTPDAIGNWSWDDTPNIRADGNYSLIASVVDKSGNAISTSNVTQIITVDTQTGQNTDPSKPSTPPTDDPNKTASVSIISIDDGLTTTDKTTGSKDTAISKDFYTSDNTLSYLGKVSGFTSNGDQVKLELKDSSGIIGTSYVTPDSGGAWFWNDQGNPRPDGTYRLDASIVDRAGNVVNQNNGGFATQKITIDNTALVSNEKPIITPSVVISGDVPKIAGIKFSNLLEDGSFNVFLGDMKIFPGDVKNGVISMQNENFTNGHALLTGFSPDVTVTGKAIHLDFTDLAGNVHRDFIDLNTNSYLIGAKIDIGFIV
jgi:hypothetical protein